MQSGLQKHITSVLTRRGATLNRKPYKTSTCQCRKSQTNLACNNMCSETHYMAFTVVHKPKASMLIVLGVRVKTVDQVFSK